MPKQADKELMVGKKEAEQGAHRQRFMMPRYSPSSGERARSERSDSTRKIPPPPPPPPPRPSPDPALPGDATGAVRRRLRGEKSPGSSPAAARAKGRGPLPSRPASGWQGGAFVGMWGGWLEM